jgi:uncharacterized repeat protein (TIGR04076 family)
MQGIKKVIRILMTKGNFGTWMKDDNMCITCCADGSKPFVLKIERIEG